MLNARGPVFIACTNLPLAFGGPLAVSIFLIILSCTGTVRDTTQSPVVPSSWTAQDHLETLWRVAFGCVSQSRASGRLELMKRSASGSSSR